jgi:hypothetical protein
MLPTPVAALCEGDKFGQGLWCNVVVSDEGDDWNMVSGTTDNDLMMAASATDAMLEAELAEIALTEMTEEKDTDVILEEACTNVRRGRGRRVDKRILLLLLPSPKCLLSPPLKWLLLPETARCSNVSVL